MKICTGMLPCVFYTLAKKFGEFNRLLKFKISNCSNNGAVCPI